MSLNKAYISSTQVASSTPFDPTTGKGFVGSDVQTALEELRDHTVYDSRTQASTAAGTLTLTSTDTNFQWVTGTAVGYTVKLPDATTLSLSAYYQIWNASSQPINIDNGAGTLLVALPANSIGFFTLQLNPNAAGTWGWWFQNVGTASGIVTYNIVSNTNFSSSANVDTLITGMSVTPQAGTYGIWYNAANTGTGAGQELDVSIYNGAAVVTDSVRSNLSTSGTHIFQNSTQTLSTFDGATACTVKINPNGNSITVGARSLLLIRFGN